MCKFSTPIVATTALPLIVDLFQSTFGNSLNSSVCKLNHGNYLHSQLYLREDQILIMEIILFGYCFYNYVHYLHVLLQTLDWCCREMSVIPVLPPHWIALPRLSLQLSAAQMGTACRVLPRDNRERLGPTDQNFLRLVAGGLHELPPRRALLLNGARRVQDGAVAWRRSPQGELCVKLGRCVAAHQRSGAVDGAVERGTTPSQVGGAGGG